MKFSNIDKVCIDKILAEPTIVTFQNKVVIYIRKDANINMEEKLKTLLAVLPTQSMLVCNIT